MRIIERDTAAAVIMSKDGKVWLGLGNPNGAYGACWKLPGGGIDEGESPLEAVMREVREEVGLDISPYLIERIDHEDSGETEKTLATGERILVRMTFATYKVVIDDKDASEVVVSCNNEFSEDRWFDTSELKNIPLPPPTIKLFSALGWL